MKLKRYIEMLVQSAIIAALTCAILRLFCSDMFF